MVSPRVPPPCDLSCHTVSYAGRMTIIRTPGVSRLIDGEWTTFPGGELEGRRPRVLCPGCRGKLQQPDATAHAAHRPLCFQCYRLELDRTRALKAAGALDTTSSARFQSILPLEPVNVARLERLRAERRIARAASRAGTGQYVDRRRRAQIAARRALQRVAAGISARPARERESAITAATHAAELQLPEAWLPFVIAQ